MHERDFTAAKPDKLIRWLHHLGTVSITVNLGDRALTVDALPMQHAVLELFTDKGAIMVLLLRGGQVKHAHRHLDCRRAR